jgi:glycosyltransferase involved in cell wall biosynthesis
VADAQLLIIGDGPFRPQLEKICRERGLTFGSGIHNEIIFLGFRDLPHRYFRLGSTFALPSSSEGFPNILIEALAAGIPVAAADTPWGAREVLGIPADAGNRPFPTTRVRSTPFGYLLPRIDSHRFDGEWVEALVHQLRSPPPTPPEVMDRRKRVRELDCGVAAKGWEALIAELLEVRS